MIRSHKTVKLQQMSILILSIIVLIVVIILGETKVI
jgi:hypothetical protein